MGIKRMDAIVHDLEGESRICACCRQLSSATLLQIAQAPQGTVMELRILQMARMRYTRSRSIDFWLFTLVPHHVRTFGCPFSGFFCSWPDTGKRRLPHSLAPRLEGSTGSCLGVRRGVALVKKTDFHPRPTVVLQLEQSLVGVRLPDLALAFCTCNHIFPWTRQEICGFFTLCAATTSHDLRDL
jgi:hypothetical protein